MLVVVLRQIQNHLHWLKSLLTLKIQIAVVKHQACLNRVNFEMGWEREMGWGVKWVGVGDGLGWRWA